MIITKSDFINYLQCSSNFWMTKHKPELVSEVELDPLIEQIIESDKEVELWARKLFPTGKYIKEYGEHALKKTMEL